MIFSGTLAPGDYDLWFIDASTDIAGRMTATATNFESHPTFAPDDARIAFTSGNWQYGISIIENALEVIVGTVNCELLGQNCWGHTSTRLFSIDT